jgi:beta-glucuronidase
VDLSAEPTTVELEMQLKGAALWSPASPALHELHVTLGGDDLRDRIGLRTLSAERGQVLINGQPVRLLGFCRHEAHPQFGHGLPDALIAADVQQLRDMNCNFVRGSHYPQDVRFLDLCDEMGICVWDESIGWQHTADHLNDPAFVAAQRRNIDEMVAVGYNRPSVILWGILNESHSHDDACREGYANLLGRLRELDASRPVTYACNHPMDDVCIDLADVIAINCYPGWYGTEIESIPGHLDRIVNHFDGEMGMADKPMILSEIGAGALYGWRDDHATRWTEAYQARLLETVIRHLFIDGDRWCGLSIWQYGDCRTSHEVRKAIGRPRAFNNKGVVDEYRRPKEAYGLVKRMYDELG